MEQLQRVLERVELACQAAGRDRSSVEVELAVKTRTAAEALRAGKVLNAAGRPALLAHNRVQEALQMRPDLLGLQGLRISMIGPLQRNKINQALRCVDEIESLASVELARAIVQRLSVPQLPVFIQVNTSGEATKSGVSPQEAVEVALQVAELGRLHVRGFMTIGAHTHDKDVVAKSFTALARVRDQAVQHPQLAHARALSMGMSGDFELAIAHGSTRVRLGAAVFGPRPAP